ncbi:hypothetical protein J2W35_004922 [Variovorax boronicumulans]|uniref:DUF3102 domain-containing protein n=1 Tax=Variovorax boronicumulans TaxID=436515 RepID=UPI002787FC25|nr:DUF3102 domain-containing protein [Variovorax boronicumulans]MDQ0084553.1 hypothetical protein [Variovorax boronicumulans]
MNTLIAPTIASDVIDKINEAITAAESNARTAMGHAIFAGNLLNTAKTMVDHGEWQAWLEAHVVVAPRTAQAYMRLARKLQELPPEEAQRVADLPLREAVRAIATPPETPPRYERRTFYRLDERERVLVAIDKSAAALRTVARSIKMGGEVDSKKIQALRAKLQGAMTLVDEIDQASEAAT